MEMDGSCGHKVTQDQFITPMIMTTLSLHSKEKNLTLFNKLIDK